ncbi:hypothetical protein DMC25_05720 [Caulobacter sp. D4A]|nr:hypothetical protein DMC25_05720 [Caulobacter sp. D4A]PXA92857.1 hypothetical protein DMC18_10005 [Caulobacter sp. D5]
MAGGQPTGWPSNQKAAEASISVQADAGRAACGRGGFCAGERVETEARGAVAAIDLDTSNPRIFRE